MHRWDLVTEWLCLSPRDREAWAGEGLRTRARVVWVNTAQGFMGYGKRGAERRFVQVKAHGLGCAHLSLYSCRIPGLFSLSKAP